MLDISSRYHPLFEAHGLVSVEAITSWFAPPMPRGKTGVFLQPKTLAAPGHTPVAVYYKQYEYAQPAWKFIGRASKAQCEAENYRVFERLRVPCTEPLAWGETRDALGRLQRAFIITREIPQALTLVEFVARHCPRGAGGEAPALRRSLRRQLVQGAQRLHRAGFFHHDFVWRNLLVTRESGEEPKLWWIDCPRGREHRWSARRALWQDLASLDKSAAKFCRAPERLAFVREYLGEARLSPSAKLLIRQVTAYRKKKWPSDWPGR